MSESETLPELAEADAQWQIACIYRELRELSGAPMVALIWRHLATYPGVLPEAWAALRPLFTRGLVQEAAWRSAEQGVRVPAASVTRSRLATAGLHAEAQDAFVRVLDAYNRANPVNFVGVRLLVQAMAGKARGQSPPERDWTPPAMLGALPPMAPISAFSPDQRRLLDSLSSSTRIDRSKMVPSLYRHLTGWPGLIPLIHADLAPRFQSGEIKRVVAGVAGAMDREAAELAPYMPPLPAPAVHAEVAETLTRFSSLIPEMVSVGLLLRRGLDQEA
jgi:hypothetical protein